MTFPVTVKIPVEISIQTQTPRVFALDGSEIVLHPKVIEWMQAQRQYAAMFNDKRSEPAQPTDCDSLAPVDMFNDKHSEPVQAVDVDGPGPVEMFNDKHSEKPRRKKGK